MTKTTKTIASVAFAMGAADRTSRADTLHLHTAYMVADNAERAAQRYEWFVNYLMSYANKPKAFVESILSGKLSKAAIDDDFGAGRYECCSKKFKDHVVRDARDSDKVRPSNHAPAKAATKAEATMLRAFIGVCGNKARALELLKAAK